MNLTDVVCESATGETLLQIIALAVKDVRASVRKELKAFNGQTILPRMDCYYLSSGDPDFCYACLAGCFLLTRSTNVSQIFFCNSVAAFLDGCRFLPVTGASLRIKNLLLDKEIEVPEIVRDYSPNNTADVITYLEELLQMNNYSLENH